MMKWSNLESFDPVDLAASEPERRRALPNTEWKYSASSIDCEITATAI